MEVITDPSWLGFLVHVPAILLVVLGVLFMEIGRKRRQAVPIIEDRSTVFAASVERVLRGS